MSHSQPPPDLLELERLAPSRRPPPRLSHRPPALRPLASVDIPLLRTQRSALRNRRLAQLGALAALLLALGGGGYALYRKHTHDPAREEATAVEPPAAPELDVVDDPPAPTLALAPPEPAKAAVDQDVPPPRVAGRIERPFGKSLSFGDALLKAGLANDEANAVIGALTGSFDFRRAHSDHVLIIERGEGGRLDRFEYRAGPTTRYEAVRNELGGFVGGQIALTVETRRVARGGYVDGQLAAALAGLKLGPSLSGVFTEVFRGRVNFSTETRQGDSFRVLADEEYVDGTFLGYGAIHALEYSGEKVGTERAFFFGSKATEGDFFDEQGRAMHGGWLRTPLRYDHVSSGFGVRMHPILKKKIRHEGIDYVAQTGTPVSAAAAGIVRLAGAHGPNGNLVSIVHPHGYETFYAHLSRFAPGLKPGKRVKQREVIAYVGSTGRSTGPHLHFALKRGGKLIDPNSQLNGPGLPLSARELPAFKQRVRELSEQLAAIVLERPEPVAPEAPAQPDFDEAEL